MLFYVYIIVDTAADSEYHTGITENPAQRLADNNESGTQYFVFLKMVETQREALIYEKKIKRLNKRSLGTLIDSEENKLEDFLKA